MDKTEWASVVREAKACSGKEEDNLKEVGPRGYDAVLSKVYVLYYSASGDVCLSLQFSESISSQYAIFNGKDMRICGRAYGSRVAMWVASLYKRLAGMRAT